MPPLHAFTTSSAISDEQQPRRTQIPSTNTKPHRYPQPNLCVFPLPFLDLHSHEHIKPKSVTDPLSECVQARLCGELAITDKATHCSTSGSNQEIESERLADMIYGYGIVDEDGSHQDCSSFISTKDSQVDDDGSSSGAMNFIPFQFCDMLQGLCSSIGTAFELCLLQNVEKAIAIDKAKASFNVRENTEQKNRCRQFVMNSLRFIGYNAGICRSQWARTSGHPAGSYEFIDVVIEESKLTNERFFVDIDFRAQFEIARPTASYNYLLQKLPTLFVGRADKLCSIVKIMCDSARRSLKETEMYIPPWRKFRYMQNKWLASYMRTTNRAAARAAENALFQFPYASWVLKTTGWDAATVVDQIEKGSVALEKNLSAKSKSTEQANERFESRDRFPKRGNRDRLVNKISGLAAAFAEAGVTRMTPS